MRGLALFAALALGACMGGPSQTRFESGGLDGQWRIVSLNSRPVAGAMQLERGRMRVSFGCNWGSGPFRIGRGRLIPVQGLAVTEMACQRPGPAAPDPMAVEAAGFRLVSKPMWIAGTLENRRLRLWNDAGWLLAEFVPAGR